MSAGSPRRGWRRLVMPVLVLAGLSLLSLFVYCTWNWAATGRVRQASFSCYTVGLADLPIMITERGTVGAQKETEIRCLVENRHVTQTQIVYLIPNGSVVKKGDLLVELDSRGVRDHLEEHTLDHIRAVGYKITRDSMYENQLLQNEINLAEAKLAVELAAMRLDMYLDGEFGTYRLALEEGSRDILEKKAALELAVGEENGNQTLFNLGYRGKSQLDQSRFRRLQAQDGLASSVSKQQKLTEYEYKMQKLRLEGAVKSRQRALRQVVNNNASLLIQAESYKHYAERSEARHKDICNRLAKQVENTRVYAPHDGMVVHARDGRSGMAEVSEGVMVSAWQRILTLPDPSRMQVKTEVHEAVLDQVQPGAAVAVRVDAFPGQVFPGRVFDVAVLPSSQSTGWISTGVKTYQATVQIEGEVEGLRPGMTAVVDISADSLREVLAVPVQAVVQKDRENWCYVATSLGVEKRWLKVGRSNGEFVHIRDGLAAGDRVLLDPAPILEAAETGTRQISPEYGAAEMPKALASSDAAKEQAPSANAAETLEAGGRDSFAETLTRSAVGG